MKEKILEWCRTLAASQGFYGRLLEEFEEHPEKLEEVVKILYGETWNIPKTKKDPWIEENYGIYYNVGSKEKLIKEVKRLRKEWEKIKK
jgi:hypothetical protein